MKEPIDGAILQRDLKSIAIVPRTPVGVLSANNLESLARVVRKFDIPAVKITSGQRLALVGIPAEKVDAVWAELGMDVGHAVELCVHYVQACPGTTFCRLGVRDSIGLGQELESRLAGTAAPAKVKIGVSGCPICCAESYVRDLGLVATKHGWTLVFGGNSGARPRVGDVLAEGLSREEAIDLAERVLAYYCEQNDKRVRTFRFAERVGVDKIKQDLGLA